MRNVRMLLSGGSSSFYVKAMRYFFLIIIVLAGLTSVRSLAEEKLTNYMQNKMALERAVKIYLAFEARHDVGPGLQSDLNLPDKAKFHKVSGETKSWIFPISIGLEVKIGSPQRRVVVISPNSSGGRYLVGTDDLKVQSYSKSELSPIFERMNSRRKKLGMRLLD